MPRHRLRVVRRNAASAVVPGALAGLRRGAPLPRLLLKRPQFVRGQGILLPGCMRLLHERPALRSADDKRRNRDRRNRNVKSETECRRGTAADGD